MPLFLVNTCTYIILVHGKYGLCRVQCVWFTLSDSPIRTATYSEPYVC